MQITYSKYVIYDPETNHKHNSFFHCALLFGDFVTVQVLHKTENTLQSQKMCSNKKCNAQNLHILYITVAQQWRRIGLIPPILRIWPLSLPLPLPLPLALALAASIFLYQLRKEVQSKCQRRPFFNEAQITCKTPE